MRDYPTTAERFARDTEGHVMTIQHDDGLYRHVTFRDPNHQQYWFELVTSPGSLTFHGDGDSFVFRRERDMFGFFRGNHWRSEPNIDYWAEKLTAPSGRNGVKRYDEDKFRQLVRNEISEAVEDDRAPEGLAVAVDTEIMLHADLEHEARAALDEFEYKGFSFSDTWEWDCSDYTTWFIWACHAILWGIYQYDQAASVRSEESHSNATAVL